MGYLSELRGMPRALWLLFAVALINRTGTMALPFLLLYLTRHLGFSVTEAGMVVGAYGVGALAVSPVAGWLSDRWGPMRVMLVSLFSSAAVMALFPSVHGYAAVFAVTILWASVNDLFRPAIFTCVGDILPPARRKVGFAVIRLAVNLGMSVGPAAGGFLVRWSFPALFYANAVATVSAGLVLWWFQFRRGPARAAAPAAAPGAVPGLSMLDSVRDSLSDRRLLYFMLAMMPVELVFFQHESTLAHFMVHDLSLTEADYGLLFTINTLLICTLELPLNIATAHWAHRYNLALGALLFAVGFGSMAFAGSFGAMVGATVVWTVGEMTLLPQAQAYLNDLSPPDRRGSYMGMYVMGFAVSFILAPALGALVLDSFGARVLWAGCLAVGLVSALLLWRVPGCSTVDHVLAGEMTGNEPAGAG